MSQTFYGVHMAVDDLVGAITAASAKVDTQLEQMDALAEQVRSAAHEYLPMMLRARMRSVVDEQASTLAALTDEEVLQLRSNFDAAVLAFPTMLDAGLPQPGGWWHRSSPLPDQDVLHHHPIGSVRPEPVETIAQAIAGFYMTFDAGPLSQYVERRFPDAESIRRDWSKGDIAWDGELTDSIDSYRYAFESLAEMAGDLRAAQTAHDKAVARRKWGADE